MNTSLTPFGVRSPSPYGSFHRELDTLMSRFFGEEGEGHCGEMTSWFRPTCNISESDESWNVAIDLPGMTKDDINVEIRNGELWITGERREESEDKDKTWHHTESRYGRIQRRIRLGEDLDVEQVDAEYKDGVLRISVPKTEVSRTKHVEVKC